MADIKIIKINEVWMHVLCDRGIAAEVSEYFTFFAENYIWHPKYKAKVWDGKIRMFNLKEQKLYVGLIAYVEEFARERQYTIEYENEAEFTPDTFSLEEAKEFATSLDLHSDGTDIVAYEHQVRAFALSIRNRRQGLLSPTASGKSLISYMITRYLLSQAPKSRGLIIVPTVNLCTQLYDDFKDYSTKNGWDADTHCQMIYQGQTKNITKNVTISTWQSIYEMTPAFLAQFDWVIGEEGHLFNAKSLTKIMEGLVNAKYRITSTGTLDGSKVNKLVLEGLFGTFNVVATNTELMEKGLIAQLRIKCILLKHSEEARQALWEEGKLEYDAEKQYLIDNYERNKFIRNLVLSLKGNTLVLYERVEDHGEVLYEMTKEKTDKYVSFIHGGVPIPERDAIKAKIKTLDESITFASFGTYQTGVSIKNIHNLVIAFPAKGRIRNLQSIGRALRISSTKWAATLYDIADDLRYKKKVNHTIGHLEERIKIYNEEGFEYKLYLANLKD